MIWTLPKGLPSEAYELGPLIAQFKSPKLLPGIGLAFTLSLSFCAFTLAVVYGRTEDVWLIATFGGYGGVVGLVLLGIFFGAVIPWLIFMNVWVWREQRVFVCELGLVQTKGPIRKPEHFYGERSAQVCRWDQIDAGKRTMTRSSVWQEMLWGRKRRPRGGPGAGEGFDYGAGRVLDYEMQIGSLSLQSGGQVLMTLSRGELASFDKLIALIQAKSPSTA
jgi:hypothetical protein